MDTSYTRLLFKRRASYKIRTTVCKFKMKKNTEHGLKKSKLFVNMKIIIKSEKNAIAQSHLLEHN